PEVVRAHLRRGGHRELADRHRPALPRRGRGREARARRGARRIDRPGPRGRGTGSVPGGAAAGGGTQRPSAPRARRRARTVPGLTVAPQVSWMTRRPRFLDSAQVRGSNRGNLPRPLFAMSESQEDIDRRSRRFFGRLWGSFVSADSYGLVLLLI